MGKRSDFERKPRDFYPTPHEAVVPLLPLLVENTRFYEPCYGEGDLARHLETHGHICEGGSDKYPVDDRPDWDATDFYYDFGLELGSYFITNPPWDRKILHPIIDNLRKQKPTWLLIDADWAQTKQAAPYLLYCDKIVAVGRVKWIPDSKYTGKDNCCWYLFQDQPCETKFIGRKIN